MCGLIIAPVDYFGVANKAIQKMGHRSDGRWSMAGSSHWLIGHARLGIQGANDPRAEQPWTHDTGATAFVGEFFTDQHEAEIVNRLVVKRDLDPHELDGFWSIAHADENEAYVWTDHLGIKPLYHWEDHNIIASEIPAMFALEPPPPLDEIHLGNCIKWGYDPTGRTPWQGIRQIPPGTRVSMVHDQPDQTRYDQYWFWEQVPTRRSLREALDKAILNRANHSDLPVALLLSGGLDSSIVYYTLRDHGIPVEAFSIPNGEDEYLPEGISTLILPEITPYEALRGIHDPIDLGSLLPQYALGQAIKDRGYVVCMSGDGADELFGGYTRARRYDSQGSDMFCELPYYHLPRLDRVMMHHTIELRSPYLSPEVAAIAMKIPREQRTQKQALKEAYRGLVPDKIIDRAKKPLKSRQVVQGLEDYRIQLVEDFRHVSKDL